MRLATPISKYWVCKRQPGFVYEALECFGGAGFVEEGPMPRLYRQAPLNAIWEGSGNVIALDVLRAIGREPESLAAVKAEIDGMRGRQDDYDAHCEYLERFFVPGALHEETARVFTQSMALALQGAALYKSSPEFMFDAFCKQRLSKERRGFMYGDMQAGIDLGPIVDRAMPAA